MISRGSRIVVRYDQPTKAYRDSATFTDDMEKHDEHIKELARRLFAAAISCWTGVSLQHAYKNFVKAQEGDIGAYWIDLAKQVTTHRTAGFIP